MMHNIKPDCRVPILGGVYQVGTEREEERDREEKCCLSWWRKAEERRERRVTSSGIRALIICLNLKKKKGVDLIYSHGFGEAEYTQADHASLARLHEHLSL